MMIIEQRPYGFLEGKAAIAAWFACRGGAARMRAFVQNATHGRTSALSEVAGSELPDMLGALVLMQRAAA